MTIRPLAEPGAGVEFFDQGLREPKLGNIVPVAFAPALHSNGTHIRGRIFGKTEVTDMLKRNQKIPNRISHLITLLNT